MVFLALDRAIAKTSGLDDATPISEYTGIAGNECLSCDEMSLRLYTIGYQGMDLPVFVDCLAAVGVECVLDVRENPFSRKPGFSKRPLSQALEARGIRYVHLKELGTPRPLREKVKLDGDYDRFFQEMRRHLATQEGVVAQACDYVRRMVCCLICYEASADNCHRKIVAQVIQDRIPDELQVIHLPGAMSPLA